jgi:hypothetical protein
MAPAKMAHDLIEMSGAVWIGVCILLGALLMELFAPKSLLEGFQAIGAPVRAPALQPATTKSNILTNIVSRRGDVGFDREDGDYLQDRRYFAGYADVQRYGVQNDFCRMLIPLGGKPAEMFFACALAGTAPAPTTGYKTEPVKNGFLISRDDYMRDILRDGREAYCRILKGPNGFLPQCRRALDDGFSKKDELDTNPPDDIQQLVTFYEGCEFWLRLRDDMLDYIGRGVITTTGGLSIDETPRPIVTKGIHFNGHDQFVRFGDTQNLEMGSQIKMRTLRAFSVWAKFDAFTNNAHIFDMGDGPGNNNVFLGILGKGDGDAPPRKPGECDKTTVPDRPSGAQFCPELKAQDLLEDSAGNVDEYVCPGPEVLPRNLPPIQTKPRPVTNATRATLIYEVWDKTLRKVQIKINRAVPLKEWVHLVVTATSMDAMSPQLKVYVNGEDMYTLDNGALPQSAMTTNNYLGKSNWASGFTLYEMQDELFQGSVFDFRMYSAPLTGKKIRDIYTWGKNQL